jgi:hypothetical protein
VKSSSIWARGLTSRHAGNAINIDPIEVRSGIVRSVEHLEKTTTLTLLVTIDIPGNDLIEVVE